MKDLTIVVGTIGQSIMRSEDNGQTWARIGPVVDSLTKLRSAVSP